MDFEKANFILKAAKWFLKFLRDWFTGSGGNV